MRELMDKLELKIFLMCFLSQYLEKRIFGLQNLVSKIHDAERQDRMARNDMYRRENM